MAKKKLLIYSHYYVPDTASTEQILKELAEGMLDTFDITIVCFVPSYLEIIENKYKTQPFYKENINGVKVIRICVPEFSKISKKSRIKNILSYFFGATKAVKMADNQDYIFSISPLPIFGGMIECYGKRKKYAEFRNLIYINERKVQKFAFNSEQIENMRVEEAA